MTVLRSGSASDVGRVRSANEDRLLESVALFAVADGMGGHAGGEVAAGLAIEVLQRWFTAEPSARGLVDAVRRANLAVWERSHQDAEVRGMGTTLTTAALVPTATGDKLVVANVGDSRAYRYAGGRLVQMTTDHSVAEELVARGELSEAEAAVHPHRHILTRALGVAPEVDVDAWELAPGQGERFLLCSDGLTNEVSEDRIAAVLDGESDPRRAAETLVTMANEHGGSDNVTVVVLDVVVADPVAPEDGGAGVATGATDGGGASETALSGVAAATAGDGPDTVAGAGASGGDPGSPSARTGAPPRGGVGSGVARGGPSTATRSATVGAVRSAPPRSSAPTTANGGATALRPSGPPPAGGGDGAGPPEMLARHVTTALSEVMGRRSVRRLDTDSGERHAARRLTLRVVLFVLLVAAVVAGAVAVIRTYAEDAWFVRLDGDRVAIYQGRPGGFLGFSPRVLRVTDLTSSDVLAFRVPELRAAVSEPSVQAADRFVTNLRAEYCAVQPTAPSCPTSSSGTVPSSGTTSSSASAAGAGSPDANGGGAPSGVA